MARKHFRYIVILTLILLHVVLVFNIIYAGTVEERLRKLKMKREFDSIFRYFEELDYLILISRPLPTPTIPLMVKSKPFLTTETKLWSLKEEVENTKQLKQTLSENFKQYTILIEQEQHGMNVSKQMISLLKDMTANLKELEKLYEGPIQEKPELLQEFQRVKNAVERLGHGVSGKQPEI